MFKKAQRQKAKLRLALIGPAGSGKTYSSLQIAQGMGGRIAMIDTERGSGELYSHLCDYDVLRIDPPFEPRKYIDGIKAAEEAGYDVLIIDSLSHAWAGDGGILTIHDRVAKAVRNSFDAWREVTPQHNQLVDAILDSSCHVIATMRSKTAYEVVTENGKTRVSKVGLAPIQREGLEYEFTVVMDLSVEGHVATTTKDRTGLFDGKCQTPGRKIGKLLINWLGGGIVDIIDNNVSEVSLTEGSVSLAYVHQLLDQVGMRSLRGEYLKYVLSRYAAESWEKLSAQQRWEQVAMLRQCLKSQEKRATFHEILRQHHVAA